jgi:hypothetical protein
MVDFRPAGHDGEAGDRCVRTLAISECLHGIDGRGTIREEEEQQPRQMVRGQRPLRKRSQQRFPSV